MDSLTRPNRYSSSPDRSGKWQLPTKVRCLEGLCEGLNFVDGTLTAHALSQGTSTELNWFMRASWGVSPLLFATLKWGLFWVGLMLLERASPTNRVRCLYGVGTLFFLLLCWHGWVLNISH